MKRLLFASWCVLGLVAGAENLSDTMNPGQGTSDLSLFTFRLPNKDGGTVTSDVTFPFEISRVELTAKSSGSYKVTRSRVTTGVSYKAGETTSVDDMVGHGATVVPARFTDGELYSSTASVSADGATMYWYDGTGISGSGSRKKPFVFYSFEKDALYLEEVADDESKWTKLGRPGRFSYVTWREDGLLYDGIADSVNGTTNSAYSGVCELLFDGMTLPDRLEGKDGTSNVRYAESYACWEGALPEGSAVAGETAHFWRQVIGEGQRAKMLRADPYVSDDGKEVRVVWYLGSNGSSVWGYYTIIEYDFAEDALYLYQKETNGAEEWKAAEFGRPGRFSYDATNYAIVDSVTGVTSSYSDAIGTLFADVTFPTLKTPDGEDTRITFVPSTLSTNFVIWAQCALTSEVAVVDVAATGAQFSTNLEDVVVLPGDVLKATGTVAPACSVFGIGRK